MEQKNCQGGGTTGTVNTSLELIPQNTDTNVNSKFTVMFSNVDVYSIDKVLELRSQIDMMEDKPKVIGLIEVKPKHFRFVRNTEEYKIEGYEMIENNLFKSEGRGLLIYVKYGIKFTSVPLKSLFCEYCCLEINLQGGNLVLALVYRSPSSAEHNNQMLMDLMQEVNYLRAPYKVIMGDFNLPQIDWRNLTTNTGLNDLGTKFVEKVRDFFVTTCT